MDYTDGIIAAMPGRPRTSFTLCSCGCGEYARAGRKWATGHTGRKVAPLEIRASRLCEHCEQPFTPKRTGVRGQRFCGRPCGSSHWPRKSRPVEERFWEKVIIDGPVMREELGPCYGWKGTIDPAGYARISGISKRGKREPVYAHILAWEVIYKHGPVPSGLDVGHHCDYAQCTREDHIFPCTRSRNIQDCYDRGRR